MESRLGGGVKKRIFQTNRIVGAYCLEEENRFLKREKSLRWCFIAFSCFIYKHFNLKIFFKKLKNYRQSIEHFSYFNCFFCRSEIRTRKMGQKFWKNASIFVGCEDAIVSFITVLVLYHATELTTEKNYRKFL